MRSGKARGSFVWYFGYDVKRGVDLFWITLIYNIPRSIHINGVQIKYQHVQNGILLKIREMKEILWF